MFESSTQLMAMSPNPTWLKWNCDVSGSRMSLKRRSPTLSSRAAPVRSIAWRACRENTQGLRTEKASPIEFIQGKWLGLHWTYQGDRIEESAPAPRQRCEKVRLYTIRSVATFRPYSLGTSTRTQRGGLPSMGV